MITLAFINFMISLGSQLFNLFTSPVHDVVANLATNITGLQVPLIFYDVINMAVLFLPVGTIFVLFSITTALICISTVLGFAHFALHFLGVL